MIALHFDEYVLSVQFAALLTIVAVVLLAVLLLAHRKH